MEEVVIIIPSRRPHHIEKYKLIAAGFPEKDLFLIRGKLKPFSLI